MLLFLIGLVLFSSSSWSASKDCVDELTLSSILDLVYDFGLPTVSPSMAGHYFSKTESQTIRVSEQTVSFGIPILKGFRITNATVVRMGRPLGKLGKTNRGRYVLLEPFGESVMPEAEYRALYCMTKLAVANVGVPVVGLTTIRGKRYVVRPLTKGFAPMAFWGSLYGKSTFAQILDLQKMEEVLMRTYPGYVRWGLVRDASWMNKPSDADFEHEHLDPQFAIYLNQFLEQIKFIATDDGHLLIEKLPSLVTDFAFGSPYPIVHSAGEKSWRFQRWNWYRYLLAAQLARKERPIFESWLKKTDFVEWLMRYQFIGYVVRNSPAFPGPRVRMTQAPFGMTEDRATPFVRPANLNFKDQTSLRYHFRKHGAVMNYADEDAYLKGAKDFIWSQPLDDRLYFARQNGDIVLTDRGGSRMAVFSPNGQIRTYMQPSVEFHGHNYNNYYFYEQILKGLDFL